MTARVVKRSGRWNWIVELPKIGKISESPKFMLVPPSEEPHDPASKSEDEFSSNHCSDAEEEEEEDGEMQK